MEKLSAAEVNKLPPVTSGKSTRLRSQLLTLNAGEAIVLPYTEWKTKYLPYVIVNKLAKQMNWQFESGRMLDGSGWIFKRVK
jgi:hypothetical protein